MLFLLGSAFAAPGDLDPSFGTDGIAEATPGIANAMALQPDGTILVAGYTLPLNFAVARYTGEGRLDRSFGTDGTATGPSGTVLGMAVQTDGKIVVTGYTPDESMSVVRFTADGNLDTSFGSGGVIRGPQGDAFDVALQADGKIVVAGGSVDPVSSLVAITVLRFEPDGTPDAGFGSNGVVRTPLGLGSNARALALQPDGKIVVAGASDALTIVRYESDGSLDQTFGSGGVARTTADGVTSAEALALGPNGKIVAAGNAGLQLAVAQFLPDGRPDSTFGYGGATRNGTGGMQEASDVAVDADGRIVAPAFGPTALTLVRFRTDGSLDPEFGDEGISSTKMGSFAHWSAVALQPNGRILAAGSSSSQSGTNFALARFRATSPTTIAAAPVVVRYGSTLDLSGTALDPAEGAGVQILARGCYQPLGSRPTATHEGPGGKWAARVTPRSRTGYRAEILGERSVSVSVQVRPRVTIRRLAHSRVRVRVQFGRDLTGETIRLQHFRSLFGWTDIRRHELQRAGRSSDGVLAGSTFKALRRDGPFRALIRQPNRDACYADGFSRPIR